MDLREAYRVLELSVGANEEAVRDARKTLAKVWHPDRHANDPELEKRAQQKLADINAAFELIRDAGFPSDKPQPEPSPHEPPRAGEPPKPSTIRRRRPSSRTSNSCRAGACAGR